MYSRRLKKHIHHLRERQLHSTCKVLLHESTVLDIKVSASHKGQQTSGAVPGETDCTGYLHRSPEEDLNVSYACKMAWQDTAVQISILLTKVCSYSPDGSSTYFSMGLFTLLSSHKLGKSS